jgi:hypothetical protein
MKVFVLQHVHQTTDGDESVKLIGIYSTRNLAEDAIKRASRLPGFIETIDGFNIDEYELDKDYWSEGFKTIEEE